MPQFNINMDAAVVMTNRLEKLHRSALPVAIRRTLDGAAFDVKKRTLLRTTSKTFEQRKKTFFKAKSRVFKAKGFNVKTMKSTIGFIDGDEQAVDDLEKQEKGGKIGGRSFIPLDSSRTSNSLNKNVRKKDRISGIKGIVDARKAKGVNKKQKFVKSVFHAGAGGHVLTKWEGKQILWRVNSVKRTKKGKFKLTGLFSYEKKRSAQIKATHFMERSAFDSQKMIPRIYQVEGMKQIKRLMK